MAHGFAPVGSALPRRRDDLIEAAGASAAPVAPAGPAGGWEGSINVPRARDRMLEFFEREQLPGDVKQTLAAALNGDLHLQHLLFVAMMDSWPKLQKNIGEIARLVSIAPWKVVPFAPRGKKAEPAAERFAAEVEEFIWSMKPRPARGECGFEGTVKALATGFYFGHTVAEIRWEKQAGAWKPRATKPLPARYYGYPFDEAPENDPEDRLMLDPEGLTGLRNLVDFPEHRFLIGVNKGHPGHPAVAAPLRALAAYWLAAVYGLKWFMSFTQLYGIPWRHAEVASSTDDNAVKSALASIGSNGYIVTRPGTKINILSDASASGQSLPQRELIELADKQCDVFILGQTLTSGTDGSGSRALGEVHQETKLGNVDAVADHVGEILTHQLVPAIVAVNWGEGRDELPQIWAKREEAKDEKAAAERMEILTRMKLPMTEAFVYEDLGVPVPAAGDKLFQPAPDGAQGDPATGPLLPHETKEGLGKSQVAAADAAKKGDNETDEIDEKGKQVSAGDAGELLTVDQLAAAVLEGLTGVTREWLSPVRPAFERLAALAMSRQVTDEDFLAALEKARRELPELFDVLDTGALEEAFENAIGSAMLAGSVSRYER